MKSPLSSLLVISALFLSTTCKAQMISLTLNFSESTTVTDTATLSVLGYCVSHLDSFCRLPKHRRRYYSSLEERISTQLQDNDALQYDPSTVEKLEVTIGPEEKRSPRNSFKEDLSPSIIRSPSNQQQERFLRYKPFLYPTVNHKNRPLLSILFRPVMYAWGAMVGATKTFFNTFTSTHTSMEYVKETTSTATLFACINDLANNAILNEFPKCLLSKPETSDLESPSTTTIPITVDGSSTVNNQIDSFTPPIILPPSMPELLSGNIPDETELEETLEDETTTDANTMSGETSTLPNWAILPTTPYTASPPGIEEHPSQSMIDPTMNNGCNTYEWIKKVKKIMLFVLEFSPP